MFFVLLLILTISFGAQIFLRPFTIYRYLFIAVVILISLFLLFQTYQQYQFWLENDISKHLLPPYQGINYFIYYAFIRFFSPYLISLTVAVLFLFLIKILNKKYAERLFYPEEIYLGALSIFLVGHPGWLFYTVFILIIYILIHISSLIFNHKSYSLSKRLSLYWLWLPTAIFVILIQRWLEILPIWQILRI